MPNSSQPPADNEPLGEHTAPAVTSAESKQSRRAVVALLVDVFEKDPVWRAHVPLAGVRAIALRLYYRRAVRRALRSGRIDVIQGAHGTPLAVSLWFITQPANGDPARWHLEAVVVADAARGKGYGGSLLRHTLTEIDSTGAVATLEASSPDSQRLYERFGFVPEVPAPESPWTKDLPMRREPPSSA